MDWTHINNIFWTVTEMRLADLYKLFLWDFNSREGFEQELNNIYAKNHKEIVARNKVNVAKKYRED